MRWFERGREMWRRCSRTSYNRSAKFVDLIGKKRCKRLWKRAQTIWWWQWRSSDSVEQMVYCMPEFSWIGKIWWYERRVVKSFGFDDCCMNWICVEVYRRVCARLSARYLRPTLHNVRPSANTILCGKSFPDRSSTGQNCDNAEKGFRLCRTEPVEQFAWGNSFVCSACQSGYN